MITKTNIRHPSMIAKINQAMIKAVKNFNEEFKEDPLIQVKNKKGDVVLSVFYTHFAGFIFAEEVGATGLKNITKTVLAALREYDGQVFVK